LLTVLYHSLYVNTQVLQIIAHLSVGVYQCWIFNVTFYFILFLYKIILYTTVYRQIEESDVVDIA